VTEAMKPTRRSELMASTLGLSGGSIQLMILHMH
jgi:hypothetical protein